MQVTQTIENVTLSLPNADLAVLRTLSRRMGWKMKMNRKSSVEKTLEDEAESRACEAIDQLEAQSTTPPPCQYTEEEVVQRVLQATAEVDAGKGLMTLDEFEKLVETW